MGQGGGHGSMLLRNNQVAGVVGGEILNGEHLDEIVGALAGDGSGDGKAEGGGLCIAATLLFHYRVICLQRIAVRQGRTKNKRSDKLIPAATNGDYPSQICSPAGCRRWMERGSRMLLPRAKFSPSIRRL